MHNITSSKRSLTFVIMSCVEEYCGMDQLTSVV